jgi:hypothetical protein
MPEPSPEDFRSAFGLLSHLYLTPALVVLLQGRVPDHLDAGPLPASELAKQSGLHALTLTRVLRALTAFGAFREVSPGVFANNTVSDLFRDRPGGLRNAALFWGGEHVMKSAAELGHSVKTGESSFEHVYGESFWDRMHRLPAEHEMFNRALADLRSDEHQQIAGAYDWTHVKTVVDVGGGAGSLLAAILEKQEGARGVLVEQPEVLPDADRNSGSVCTPGESPVTGRPRRASVLLGDHPKRILHRYSVQNYPQCCQFTTTRRNRRLPTLNVCSDGAERSSSAFTFVTR